MHVNHDTQSHANLALTLTARRADQESPATHLAAPHVSTPPTESAATNLKKVGAPRPTMHAPVGLPDLQEAAPDLLTIDGLMAAWGTDDARYDFDGDGTVGQMDLNHFLNNMPMNKPQSDPPTEVAETVNADPIPTIGEQSPDVTADTDALTLDGLLAAWGTENARYDFDGNGTVGQMDLNHFLNNMPANAQPPAPPIDPAESATTGPVPSMNDQSPELTEETDALTLDGLLAAWGTADSRYDFDGDGTVGQMDLNHYLNNMPANEVAPSQGSDTANAAALTGDRNPEITASDDPLTVEGLLAAWGTDNPKYDFNGDGKVGQADLNHFLNNMPMNKPESGRRASVPQVEGVLGPIVGSMVQRLQDNGFGTQPPVNIHDFVDQLKLSQGEKNFVRAKLSDHYPKGLGISMIG